MDTIQQFVKLINDQFLAWITGYKIPFGAWMAALVNFLKTNFKWFFDIVTYVLGTLITGLTNVLLFIPAPIFIILAVALAYWMHRSWKMALFLACAFLVAANLGYWKEMVQTIALVGSATLVCVVLGIPLGIAAAHRPRLYAILHPVLDMMQTLPTFVYLIPTMVFFGLGAVPGLIATVIFAVPAPIRLTHLGVSSVPRPLIEAGESFGATKSQLLWKVEVPHALPTIMAGVTQCIMLSLSMVVIAALVGATGLGTPVVRALNTVNIPMGFESGIVIVLLAIVLDRVCRAPTRTGSH